MASPSEILKKAKSSDKDDDKKSKRPGDAILDFISKHKKVSQDSDKKD